MDDRDDISVNVRSVGRKESVHEPVLLHEVVEALITSNDAIKSHVAASSRKGAEAILTYLDGTLGGAGHALAIAGTFSRVTDSYKAKGKLNVVGLDQEEEAITRAKKSLSSATRGQVILENENFRNLDKVLDKHNMPLVDMILLDIGISSDELETSGRGFSFMKDEPLIMTLGDPAKYPFTAKDIVNNWKEEDIANVIFAYGEERYARRIASKIINYRVKKQIETSSELAEIVKSAIPFIARGFASKGSNTRRKIHPATKTFQALRIAVNDELNALKEGLTKGFTRLAHGGRMAVISFHSLEDRIVKEYFRGLTKDEAIILTKKPITPTDQEKAENPRSRSAKLRIIQKL